MENSVVVHEFGHGLSNRLIGGGTATCLSMPESRGLGEGWSDTLAKFVVSTALHAPQLLIYFVFTSWMIQTSAITKDFVIGTYLISPSERPNGFRTYPYSINK